MARLTETEKQEIIRFLEAGKPLPDKYRFLLFDEKRQDRSLEFRSVAREVEPGPHEIAVTVGSR